MKNIFTIVFCFCSILNALANDTLFFKHNAISVESRENAVLYKLTEVVGEDSNQVLETTYTLDNRIVARTFYIDYQSKIKHGDQLFFYDNSIRSRKEQYYNGKQNGLSTSYSVHGDIVKQSLYRNGDLLSDTVLVNPDSLYHLSNKGWMEDMPIFYDCIDLKTKEKRDSCTGFMIRNFIGKNTKYPAGARDNDISGKIYVRVIMNDQGTLDEIEVVKTVRNGQLLADEAIRVTLSLPKMIPGSQYGENVPVQYTVPVNFMLEGSHENELENGYEEESGKLRGNTLSDVFILSFVSQRGYREMGLKIQNVDRMPIWTGCHLKGTAETEDDCTEWRLARYVNKNVVYPEEWKTEKIRAICVMIFDVDKTGKVESIRNMDKDQVPIEMHNAAVAVIESLPDFIPAKLNGKPVNFTFNVAVRFKY